MSWTDGLTGIFGFPRIPTRLKGAVLAAPLFFSGTASAMPQGPQIPDHLEKTAFSDLAHWASDDHLGALRSFLRFCGNMVAAENSPTALGYGSADIARVCALAEQAPLDTAGEARRFFETHFTPYRVSNTGFVTGYFEPEVDASRKRTDRFFVPLHRKPEGLEAITADNKPANWPAHLSHGRRQGTGIREMPDRAAIMDGALDDEKLELVWLSDPIEAYFIHVQGSARLRLTDGSIMRIGYAGKTGHPYTGIGRLLVKRGEGTPEDFTMPGLKAWLSEDANRRDALFKKNRSYIFFREVSEAGPDDGPVGAAGLPLTPGRSLAIDPDHFSYGALVHVEAEFSDPETPGRQFSRLMVADDTGSAIKGPARGDIFTGSGADAGELAGKIRHKATFTVLVPDALHPGAEAVTD